MTDDSWLQGLIAIVGGFASYFIGGFSGIVEVLVVLVICDFIMGVIKAFWKGRYSSDVGFHGISKKVCMFMFIGIANIIDHEMLGSSEVLKDSVIIFYIANEGLSIVENAIELNVPVPDIIRERFLTWRNKDLYSKNEPEDAED